MSHTSTLRKLRIVGDIASRSARRRRLISAGWQAVKVSARSVGGTLQRLCLEVTGVVFLAFAGIGAAAALRAYRAYLAHVPQAGERILVATCFTLAFAWFGVSSLWHAWRPRKP